jgi:hypothetical protein
MSLYCTLHLEAKGAFADAILELERDWGLIDYLLRADSLPDEQIKGFLTNDYEALAPEVHRIGTSEIAQIAEWLSQASSANLIDAFDPQAMARVGVYDADLVLRSPLEYRQRLEAKIDLLRSFLEQAVTERRPIVRVTA